MTKKIFIVFMSLFSCGILTFFGIQSYINSYGKYIISTPQDALSVDCIFVLGAGVFNGQPTAALEDRLLNAYELYQSGASDKILVSGDHGTAEYDEVIVMKNYLIKLGVPRESILQDHAGFNTYDSMYRAKEIFEVESMIICTNNFHIRRSIYIARRMDIQAHGYPTPDKEIYDMPAMNAREKLAKIKAFLDVEILRRKPKYGGEAIPIMTNTGEATDDI